MYPSSVTLALIWQAPPAIDSGVIDAGAWLPRIVHRVENRYLTLISPEADIRTAALTKGLQLMRDDGERLIAQGITSREEVVRVTRD